jgi:hypothetical protein
MLDCPSILVEGVINIIIESERNKGKKKKMRLDYNDRTLMFVRW